MTVQTQKAPPLGLEKSAPKTQAIPANENEVPLTKVAFNQLKGRDQMVQGVATVDDKPILYKDNTPPPKERLSADDRVWKNTMVEFIKSFVEPPRASYKAAPDDNRRSMNAKLTRQRLSDLGQFFKVSVPDDMLVEIGLPEIEEDFSGELLTPEDQCRKAVFQNILYGLLNNEQYDKVIALPLEWLDKLVTVTYSEEMKAALQDRYEALSP